MNIEAVRQYCLSKPGTTEGTPFGEDVLVFKVLNKMFALINLARLPLSIGLKCDPERAVDLRERYSGVQPAYHMNKKHWNTVTIDGSIPQSEILSMIDHSYDLVVQGLTTRDKRMLEQL